MKCRYCVWREKLANKGRCCSHPSCSSIFGERIPEGIHVRYCDFFEPYSYPLHACDVVYKLGDKFIGYETEDRKIEKQKLIRQVLEADNRKNQKIIKV